MFFFISFSFLSTNKYFLDSEDHKYKLCNVKLSNCETCSLINNVLNCLSCDSNDYVVVYGEKSECKLRTSMINDDNYYKDESGSNYYLCSDIRYNSVENCKTCNERETCLSCKDGYILFNSNTLCASNNELLNQKYFELNGNYYLCSDKIKGCEKCNNGNACIECNIAYDLDENDKCIPSSLTMTRYYLDQTTNKYVSCSKIENCEECTSSSECTKCKDGYELSNTSCIKSNAKSLAIAAIVLSTLAIVISIGTIFFIFFKKFFFKKNVISIEGTDEVRVNNEDPDEVVVHKRSISNNVNNNK